MRRDILYADIFGYNDVFCGIVYCRVYNYTCDYDNHNGIIYNDPTQKKTKPLIKSTPITRGFLFIYTIDYIYKLLILNSINQTQVLEFDDRLLLLIF